MRAWDYMPGVPAAGHVTSRGFWHPGPAQGCQKCEPTRTPSRAQRAAARTLFDRADTCGDCGRSITKDHDADGNCP